MITNRVITKYDVESISDCPKAIIYILIAINKFFIKKTYFFI